MNRVQRGGTPSSTSNSPFTRAHTPTAPRSPIKTTHYGKGSQELGLTLKRVIGTTCQSVTCFDCLPSSRAFAYTAGAAAVVANIDDRGAICQRFYRANPVQSTTSASRNLFLTGLGRDSPDARFKGQARDYGSSYSPRNGTDWSDSPTGKQGNVKERVKAATTLAFSPNGKYLAVGETGYKPRVLLFSLDDKAPQDIPVAVIPEHTFGVQAVAFSADSKYLASLGAVNDGFLYIWSIEEKTGAVALVASNKCSNIIKQMAWIGQSLITVGLRFVKIWRPNELPTGGNATPDQKFMRGHRPLNGRNALLGDLLEATFTCVVPLSEDRAIVCSDGGDICLLDDAERNQRLTRVANADFSITAACLDSSSCLIVTGADGSMKAFDVAELQMSSLPPTTPPGNYTPGKSTPTRDTYFVAVGVVADIAVTVNNHHVIQLRHVPKTGDSQIGDAIHDVPAHSDAVLGVRALELPNESDAAFLTWSADGKVIYWSYDCEMTATLRIPMNQSVDMYNVANELKSVTSLSAAPRTISGDRYGMLRVSDTTSGNVLFSIRAHSGEINDIAVYEEDQKETLVASSSRDRTIQLFALTASGLNLLQTLDEHAGSVTCLNFAKGGTQLISCSADRTVVVREAVHRTEDSPALFAITRTITLKNAPTSMRLSMHEDAVLISSTDRCVQLVKTRTGRVTMSFKASDSEGGDAVIMSRLAHLPSPTGPPIIAGVSSSDKSVRLYSEEGSLLARDWGHTEGVTDIAVIQPSDGQDASKLVTVAADGTIFIWDTEPRRPDSSGSDQSLQVPYAGPSAPVSTDQPLRKVISHSELAHLQRSQSIDVSENEPVSPTATTATKGPETLKHKTSRLTAKSTPRLDPISTTNHRLNQNAKAGHRSPSPQSPLPPSPSRTRHVAHVGVRPTRGGSVSTLDGERGNVHGHGHTAVGRPESRGNGHTAGGRPESRGFGSVTASTEQLCRTLKAFRQRLEKAHAHVPSESLKELESELEITLRHIGDALGRDMSAKEEQSRGASSQDASFVSAESHPSSEVETHAGAGADQGDGDDVNTVEDEE